MVKKTTSKEAIQLNFACHFFLFQRSTVLFLRDQCMTLQRKSRPRATPRPSQSRRPKPAPVASQTVAKHR